MSNFVNNTSINIKPYIDQLNSCTDAWFKENFPKEYEHGEFKPCCTNEETNVILEAINIFRTSVPNGSYTDEEVAKGIIVYYYISIVLPYYMAHQADEKFVSASETNGQLAGFYKYIIFGTDNKHNYVMDGDGTIYEIHTKLVNIGGRDYLPIEDTESVILFYMDSEGKIYKNTQVYDDESMSYTNKVIRKPKDYFNCIDLFLQSKPNARRIIDIITISDAEWVSKIRRLIMDFNKEPFTGGKKQRKNIRRQTNKRKTLIIRKKNKKTRRNGRKYNK